MTTSHPTKPHPATTGQVVPKEKAVLATPPTTASELDAWLKTSKTAEVDPDAGGYERIIAQVLSATSPDVVLTPVEAMQAKDVVGAPLLLFGFDLNESEYDVGSPFYASMQVVHGETEVPAIVNCGHKKVIAQLVKLKEFDEFPYRVMFRERGVSKVGGTPMLELVKWEQEEPPPF